MIKLSDMVKLETDFHAQRAKFFLYWEHMANYLFAERVKLGIDKEKTYKNYWAEFEFVNSSYYICYWKESGDSFEREPDEVVFSFIITEGFDPEDILAPLREEVKKRDEEATISFNKKKEYRIKQLQKELEKLQND